MIDTQFGKPLTKREEEIYLRLRLGIPNKEICDILDITKSSIDRHLHSIYKKLGKNRSEIIMKREV